MNFNFNNDRPIYIQLLEQLQVFIISGKILPGDKLPSVRELATISASNPNTVQRALMELENLGLIYTERTNGKFVTTDKKLINKYKELFAKEKVNAYFKSMNELGFSKVEAMDYLKSEKGDKNEISGV